MVIPRDTESVPTVSLRAIQRPSGAHLVGYGNMWSSENAGTFDLDAELELWTRAGHIKIKVGKKTDIRRLDMLIAHSVLGTLH